MKNYISLLILMVTLTVSQAQTENEIVTKPKSKIGWYVTPEIGAMFLDNHIGKTVGIQMGFRFFKDHLKVGYFYYGRSGPINDQTFAANLPSGVTYKGKSQLQLRADHGAFGLMIAPAFKLPNSDIEIDLPIMIGSIGAGFYMADDDRKTPDGRRVSEWENELFDGKDAAFGGLTEFGIRGLFPTKNPSVKVGLGVHYTMASDQKTYYDPTGEFYNNKLRTSLVVQFGNAKRKTTN